MQLEAMRPCPALNATPHHSKGYTKSNLKVMEVAYGKYLIGNCEIPLSSAVSVGRVTLSTVYDMEKYIGAAKTYERARSAFDRIAEEVDYLTRQRKLMQTSKEIEAALKGQPNDKVTGE